MVMTGCVLYVLSPRCQNKHMLSETYHLLAHTICLWYPATPVHCRPNCAIRPNSLPLDHTATFFNYVVIEDKCFYTSCTVSWNRSSLVHVVIPGCSPKDAYGEVLELLQIDQDFWHTGYLLWLAWMHWLKLWCGEQDQIWNELWVPASILSTVISPSIISCSVPTSTSVYGNSENIKTNLQISPPSLTLTRSRDTLQW